MGQDKRLKQPGPQWRFMGGTEEKPEEGPFLDDLYLYAVKFEDEKATISDAATWFVAGEDSRTYVPPKDPSARKLAGYKFVPAREALFYVSVEPLTNGCAVLEHLTKDQCATAKVSRSYKATVDLKFKPDHFPRLPLGHAFQRLLPDKKKTDGTLIPTLTSRWHKVYIPTKYGGYLSVKGLARGRMKLFHKEFPKAVGNRKRTEEEKGLGVREIAAGDDKDLKIEPNKHGWYYLKVEGVQEAYELAIRFCEEGHARLKKDANAKPHIPLGFYYWRYGSRSRDKLDKLVDATRKSAFESYDKLIGKTKDGAWAWEQEHHLLAQASGWAGHCHNACIGALYVALPDVPDPGVTDRNSVQALEDKKKGAYGETVAWVETVQFTRAEIQLLVAEWAGNFSEEGESWKLGKEAMIAVPDGLTPLQKRVVGSMDKRLLYYLRPGKLPPGDPTRTLFEVLAPQAGDNVAACTSSYANVEEQWAAWKAKYEELGQELEALKKRDAEIQAMEKKLIKTGPKRQYLSDEVAREASTVPARIFELSNPGGPRQKAKEKRDIMEVLVGVKKTAVKAVADNGGPAGFAKNMTALFGKAAAGLHGFLHQQLCLKGCALGSNLRDAHAEEKNNSSAAVWNHAIFLYRSKMVEHECGDHRCVDVTTELVANGDHETVIAVAPAVLGKSGRLERTEAAAVRELEYVLRFSDDGELLAKNEHAAWTRVTCPSHDPDEPANRLPLYAPSNLIEYVKPKASGPNRSGRVTKDGNHLVGKHVIGKMVDLIDKYR